LDHSGAAIALGREVIRLDSLTSSSGLAYTYAVTRGLYETQARAHAADAYTDTSVFPADRFPFKSLRTVTLGYAPVTGTGYGDEVVVARGVLRALSVDGQGEVLSLGCDSALDLVRSRMLLAQLWRGWRTRASEPAANGTWVVDWAADFPDQRPSYKPGVGLWRVGERVLYNQWTYIAGPEGDRHPAVSAGDGDGSGPRLAARPMGGCLGGRSGLGGLHFPPRRAAACGLGGSHAAAPLARRGRAGEGNY
jgi:hypothetical protein